MNNHRVRVMFSFPEDKMYDLIKTSGVQMFRHPGRSCAVERTQLSSKFTIKQKYENYFHWNS